MPKTGDDVLPALGCRADGAAEIKPIEPVWVMPAKGAADAKAKSATSIISKAIGGDA
jgi:hypothetical protein